MKCAICSPISAARPRCRCRRSRNKPLKPNSMKLSFRRFDLQFKHTWLIASSLAEGGKDIYPVVFIELRDADGVVGLGESAPSTRYHETAQSCVAFFERVDASRLSFDDLEGSMAYVEGLSPGDF